MATRKNTGGGKNKINFGKVRVLLGNETFRFVSGLIILFLSVYLFISYISFFFTGYADQSIVADAADSAASNSGGRQGANFAHFMVNDTFGIASLFLVFYIFLVALRLMRVKSIRLVKSLAICLVSTIWMSVFLGFAFWDLYKDSYVNWGGKHGKFIADFLENQIGTIGTGLLLLFSALCLLIAFNGKTIKYIRDFLELKFLRKKKKTQPEAVSENVTAGDVAEDDVDSPDESHEDNVNGTGMSVSLTDDVTDGVPYSRSAAVAGQHEDKVILPSGGNDDMPEMEIKIADSGEDLMSDEDIRKISRRDGMDDYDPRKDLEYYEFPKLDLLEKYDSSKPVLNNEEQEYNKRRITEILKSFGIEICSISATIGPTVTLYEITPEQGVRISKIRGLEDDIALSLKALGIRIIAPIPGKGTIGIEVPNVNPQIVSMYSVVASKKFQESTYDLPIAFGKTITGDVFMVDLTKMPHILVAGATGQGKSVGLNAIITSLLYKKHPSELKFVMIDPKKVEFGIYSIIDKHYLATLPGEEEPIVTDFTKAIHVLNSLCIEMDARYDLLKLAYVRNIKEYNQKFLSRQLNPEKGHRFMPYIVVVIDEFGDLIMTAGKEVEFPIVRIAQLARAVGIHMVIATQRPTANIITGTIKANFPARVAFRVISSKDSTIILDRTGANQLVGKGDMLFLQGNEPVRVQCAFVDIDEVKKITKHISHQQGYPTPFLLPEYVDDKSDPFGSAADFDSNRLDEKFEEAARLVVVHQQGSTSLIQRKFSIGYNRAGRIMDQLEKAGIVGPADGSKPRQVLCLTEMDLEMKLRNMRG